MALEVCCSAVGHWPIVLELRSSSICLQITKYCLLYMGWWRSKHSVNKLLPHVKQYSGGTVVVAPRVLSMAKLDYFWIGTDGPVSRLALRCCVPCWGEAEASQAAVCQEHCVQPVLALHDLKSHFQPHWFQMLCAALCCSPCSGRQNSNFPWAPGTLSMEFQVPGFALLCTLGSCDSLFRPVHRRDLHIPTAGLCSCSEPSPGNAWVCFWDAVPGSHCPMGSIFQHSDRTVLWAEAAVLSAFSWLRVQRWDLGLLLFCFAFKVYTTVWLF